MTKLVLCLFLVHFLGAKGEWESAMIDHWP